MVNTREDRGAMSTNYMREIEQAIMCATGVTVDGPHANALATFGPTAVNHSMSASIMVFMRVFELFESAVLLWTSNMTICIDAGSAYDKLGSTVCTKFGYEIRRRFNKIAICITDSKKFVDCMYNVLGVKYRVSELPLRTQVVYSPIHYDFESLDLEDVPFMYRLTPAGFIKPIYKLERVAADPDVGFSRFAPALADINVLCSE